MLKRRLAQLPVVAVVVLGGLSLSACVTQDYVDRRIDEVNTHVSAVDAKATSADQKADLGAERRPGRAGVGDASQPADRRADHTGRP